MCMFNNNAASAAIRTAWFSRHKLTKEQTDGLTKVTEKFLGAKECPLMIHQINVTAKNAQEVLDLAGDAEVLALVLPTEMLAEVMKLKKPNQVVVVAKNKRILVPQPDGSEAKVQFVHDGWQVVTKLEFEFEMV